MNSPDSAFDAIDYGFKIDPEDCRRRYVLLSLLSEEEVKLNGDKQRFHANIFDDMPKLTEEN